jgi:hypothetical protein
VAANSVFFNILVQPVHGCPRSSCQIPGILSEAR